MTEQTPRRRGRPRLRPDLPKVHEEKLAEANQRVAEEVDRAKEQKRLNEVVSERVYVDPRTGKKLKEIRKASGSVYRRYLGKTR